MILSSVIKLPSLSMKRDGLKSSGLSKLLGSNKTESITGRIIVPSGISYPWKLKSRDVACGSDTDPRPVMRRISVTTALQYGSCFLSSREGKQSLAITVDNS